MNKFKPTIKKLLIMHTAFLYAQVIFAITIYFVADKNNKVFDEETSKIVEAVAALFTLVSVLTGFVLFKKKVQTLKDDAVLSVAEKLQQYSTFSIIKFAMLEAPSLFAVLAFFLTGNIYFIYLAIILIVVFAAQRPTVPLIIHHLSVTREDVME